jgi:predicted nucleotide-binding protein (sugar kinase/HSP70/actin superfamily)
VLVVGEIYVRNVASSNGFIVEALERRGIRARIAGMTEFIQFSDHVAARLGGRTIGDRVDSWVRRRIEVACFGAAARAIGSHVPPPIRDVVRAAAPWVNELLDTETVLTLGASVHAWHAGEIDGVLSVGPLECLPNKLAESQLGHIGEREGLPSLTLSLNGDPVDPEQLDGFALEVQEHFRARRRPPAPVDTDDRESAPAAAPWPETS